MGAPWAHAEQPRSRREFRRRHRTYFFREGKESMFGGGTEKRTAGCGLRSRRTWAWRAPGSGRGWTRRQGPQTGKESDKHARIHTIEHKNSSSNQTVPLLLLLLLLLLPHPSSHDLVGVNVFRVVGGAPSQRFVQTLLTPEVRPSAGRRHPQCLSEGRRWGAHKATAVSHCRVASAPTRRSACRVLPCI